MIIHGSKRKLVGYGRSTINRLPNTSNLPVYKYSGSNKEFFYMNSNDSQAHSKGPENSNIIKKRKRNFSTLKYDNDVDLSADTDDNVSDLSVVNDDAHDDISFSNNSEDRIYTEKRKNLNLGEITNIMDPCKKRKTIKSGYGTASAQSQIENSIQVNADTEFELSKNHGRRGLSPEIKDLIQANWTNGMVKPNVLLRFIRQEGLIGPKKSKLVRFLKTLRHKVRMQNSKFNV